MANKLGKKEEVKATRAYRDLNVKSEGKYIHRLHGQIDRMFPKMSFDEMEAKEIYQKYQTHVAFKRRLANARNLLKKGKLKEARAEFDKALKIIGISPKAYHKAVKGHVKRHYGNKMNEVEILKLEMKLIEDKEEKHFGESRNYVADMAYIQSVGVMSRKELRDELKRYEKGTTLFAPASLDFAKKYLKGSRKVRRGTNKRTIKNAKLTGAAIELHAEAIDMVKEKTEDSNAMLKSVPKRRK